MARYGRGVGMAEYDNPTRYVYASREIGVCRSHKAEIAP